MRPPAAPGILDRMRAPSPRWVVLLLAVAFAAPAARAEFVFTPFSALRAAPHQPWTASLDDGKTRAGATPKPSWNASLSAFMRWSRTFI